MSDLIFTVPQTKPVIIFRNPDGEELGCLDFTGPKMVFTGEAEESAKVLFDYIAKMFSARFAHLGIAAICELDGCCMLRDKTPPQEEK